MGKKLIIAEKNSMARDIVSAIGGLKYNKSQDFYEGNEYVVVALSGHVLEWFNMQDYDEELKNWDIKELPFFPEEWKLKVKSDSYPKKKYNIAKKLILRDDITEIINAGDPDNEGEVLVNEVIYKVFKENKIAKTVNRLWILDHVPETIKRELKNAKDIKCTDNNYQEGLARGKTDWLYGINLTRYISCRTGKTMATGRVIVPTVKFVYDRDMAIKNFKPEKYKEVTGFIAKDGKGIKLTFKKGLKFNENDDEKIRKIVDDLKEKEITVIQVEEKEQTRQPKKLFKLSTLQIYCSNKFNFNPDKTLKIVQGLYEKGYLTYPRTNSEYMTEKEKEKAESIIKALKQKGFTGIAMNETKRIFDDSKIDSHSAITPTEKIADLSALKDDEKKVYETVRNRFLSNFCEEKCIVNVVDVIFQVSLYTTSLRGTTIKQQGYLKFENDLNDKELPEFKVGESFFADYKIEEKQKKKKKKVTQAELIKFFNKPFKKFTGESEEEQSEDDDTEEYRDILKGIEIGTEATRASTIAKVIKIGYIKEEKGKLSITDLGIQFIEVLLKLNINLWKEKTVELSKLLKEINKGQKTVEEIEKYAKDEIQSIISNGNNIEIPRISNKEVIGKCPICNGEVVESKKSYYCSNYKSGCKFTVWKQIAGKNISKTNVKELINKGITEEISNFNSKSGKSFNAKLILNNDGNIGFKF